ncbi:NB-ARC domain-containing protein [Streptomyces sp. NPDC001833]|uniref:ATP-binding protein n=1 Tax=Streptomyces sp. NPDC001833 TaxID=3154658 RepID=UPI0033286EC7
MVWMMWDAETSFVGRAAELDRIASVMGGSRLVTLSGAGGVGKTRLAQRVVSLGAAAGEGTEVAWADLSPLRNGHLLAATVADALGLSDHTPRLPADAICAWIGDRRTLLVLDSCEHLPAECRDLAGDLLTACPNLRILTTSREPLRVRGEAVVGIEPFASAEEAVALFADRAAAAGSPLVDDTDRQLAASLCEQLERLPLALELAAGQLRSMSLPDLCAGPYRAVDLPAAPTRSRPPRHAALRTTIGWSHELCTPQERLLWARLSYLPASFDDELAGQLAGGGPLSPGSAGWTLVSLCDKSVVVRKDGAYRMLDAVREYGRMWLSELGGEEELAHRHAQYVLAQTRRAHREWFGPAQRSWYRRIGFLHSDIRLAADHLLATDPAAALELIGNVTFFWVCSGYLYEARRYLETATVPAARDQDGTWVQGLWSLGLTLTLQGEQAAAHETAAACRRAAEASLDAEGLGRAAYLDGLLHLLEGRPLAAVNGVETTEPGTTVTRPGQLTAPTVLCRLVHVFGLTGSGRLDQARHEALELRDLCAALDEHWTRSYAEHQLALIAFLTGRPHDSVGHARAALDAKQHIGDAFGIAMVMDLLAIALADAGEDTAAAYAFGAATRFWETVGHPQRGTPEMAALRSECEDRLVQGMGLKRYGQTFRRAVAADARSLVSWGAYGGPVPEE